MQAKVSNHHIMIPFETDVRDSFVTHIQKINSKSVGYRDTVDLIKYPLPASRNSTDLVAGTVWPMTRLGKSAEVYKSFTVAGMVTKIMALTHMAEQGLVIPTLAWVIINYIINIRMYPSLLFLITHILVNILSGLH